MKLRWLRWFAERMTGNPCLLRPQLPQSLTAPTVRYQLTHGLTQAGNATAENSTGQTQACDLLFERWEAADQLIESALVAL
jgi:hypothetical protein